MPEIKNKSTMHAPRILYITAGAGGMYCGSCLHDNALAGALIERGIDLVLVPAYTPIRVDSPDRSLNRVVFGGINLYLRHGFPPFRWLPASWTQWLDRPGVIRRLVGNRVETNPARLGGLTLAMLHAQNGHLAQDVNEFANWVDADFQPDLVVFSNLLMAGSAPLLKQRLQVPILGILQGDDLFVNGLPAAVRETAIAELYRIALSIDQFLVHSNFYARSLAQMLSIPIEKFTVVPLGLEAPETFGALPSNDRARGVRHPATLGYLARFAPEKGLHMLCDAFVHLKRQSATAHCRLRLAGWNGPHQQPYLRKSIEPIRRAGFLADVEILGEVDHAQKLAFLRSLDVMSVPSPYADPKGIYVLEALAAGVPVVQPNHGAFPELLASTGGGVLFEPNSVKALTERLTELLCDRTAAQRLGQEGQAGVLARHTIAHTAEATWNVMQRLLSTVGNS